MESSEATQEGEEEPECIRLTPRYVQHWENQNLKGLATSLRRVQELEGPLKALLRRKAMEDVVKWCTAESIGYVLDILVALSTVGNQEFTQEMIEDNAIDKIAFINILHLLLLVAVLVISLAESELHQSFRLVVQSVEHGSTVARVK